MRQHVGRQQKRGRTEVPPLLAWHAPMRSGLACRYLLSVSRNFLQSMEPRPVSM